MFTSLTGLIVYFIGCSASVVGLAVHFIDRIAIYPLHYSIDWIASFDGIVYYSHYWLACLLTSFARFFVIRFIDWIACSLHYSGIEKEGGNIVVDILCIQRALS